MALQPVEPIARVVFTVFEDFVHVGRLERRHHAFRNHQHPDGQELRAVVNDEFVADFDVVAGFERAFVLRDASGIDAVLRLGAPL
ncbi:MAG: hypothetical protein NVSMB5_17570 [Candidatus Velthaea sp.]